MYRTSFFIAQMDCPSEEQLIRLKLSELEGIVTLSFDLSRQELHVFLEKIKSSIEI